MNPEKLEERRKAKKIKASQAEEKAKREQKEVKQMSINIEWKKSYMWGHNPHTSGRVEFMDGRFERIPKFTASGCGYCKESTVIAKVFNHYLAYLLYKVEFNGSKPYGIREYKDEEAGTIDRHYEGGVGTSCYYKIAEFIGGKFKHISNGDKFDVFTFEIITEEKKQ